MLRPFVRKASSRVVQPEAKEKDTIADSISRNLSYFFFFFSHRFQSLSLFFQIRPFFFCSVSLRVWIEGLSTILFLYSYSNPKKKDEKINQNKREKNHKNTVFHYPNSRQDTVEMKSFFKEPNFSNRLALASLSPLCVCVCVCVCVQERQSISIAWNGKRVV